MAKNDFVKFKEEVLGYVNEKGLRFKTVFPYDTTKSGDYRQFELVKTMGKLVHRATIVFDGRVWDGYTYKVAERPWRMRCRSSDRPKKPETRYKTLRSAVYSAMNTIDKEIGRRKGNIEAESQRRKDESVLKDALESVELIPTSEKPFSYGFVYPHADYDLEGEARLVDGETKLFNLRLSLRHREFTTEQVVNIIDSLEGMVNCVNSEPDDEEEPEEHQE